MDAVLNSVNAIVLAVLLALVFPDLQASGAVYRGYGVNESGLSHSERDRPWSDNADAGAGGLSDPVTQNTSNPIVEAALSYVPFLEVPYVWGGNSLGNADDCEACSQCIVKNKKRGIKKRHLNCSACRKCGFDCSHFVQTVFKSADFRFPFMSTRSMLSVTAKNPGLIPGLRFVGTDLNDAQPGDLLVHKKHVVILIRMKSESVGDIVHMSRTVRKGRIGGIELRRDTDLKKFFGGVKKILRHEKMLDPVPLGPQPSDIDMAMVSHQWLVAPTKTND